VCVAFGVISEESTDQTVGIGNTGKEEEPRRLDGLYRDDYTLGREKLLVATWFSNIPDARRLLAPLGAGPELDTRYVMAASQIAAPCLQRATKHRIHGIGAAIYRAAKELTVSAKWTRRSAIERLRVDRARADVRLQSCSSKRIHQELGGHVRPQRRHRILIASPHVFGRLSSVTRHAPLMFRALEKRQKLLIAPRPFHHVFCVCHPFEVRKHIEILWRVTREIPVPNHG
jgi:hypothetical protein